MELSKQNRIIILLIIDSAFFLLEIVAGYSVHSLALVADSFHMLNDVMSLVVALYALRLVNSKKSPKRLSYGYIRAEIVGALINGVFLLALCFTIFLSALERFFEPKEITDANLVLIVGSAGIVSNILGLLLFHEHGHSHGHAHGHSHDNSHDPVTKSLTDSSEPSSPIDVPEIFVHPARSRQSIVEAAHPAKGQSIIEGPDDFGIVSPSDSASSSSVSSDVGNKYDDINIAETTEPHCGNIQDNNMASRHSNISEHGSRNSYDSSHSRSRGHSHGHGSKKHAHRHRSLNMHGVFLHVLGDFLGNIGVVATALFIKLTTYSWRFYMDPVISLVITVIIFSSALPLVQSACLILLQSVPKGLPIDNVHDDIANMKEVISVHELHIWQLSENKLIASLHVLLMPSADYMSIATKIRQTLHAYGIHSTTIQPEFVKTGPEGKGIFIKNLTSGDEQFVNNELEAHESACLLLCSEDETCARSLCCPPLDNSIAL